MAGATARVGGADLQQLREAFRPAPGVRRLEQADDGFGAQFAGAVDAGKIASLCADEAAIPERVRLARVAAIEKMVQQKSGAN